MDFFFLLGSICGFMFFYVIPGVLFFWLIVSLIRYLKRH